MYILSILLVSFARALLLLMFCRAILSWIPSMRNSSIYSFLYTVTEPIIIPVRIILSKIPYVNSMPIDISFFVTYLLLSFIA